jgi:hypothetical protein
MTQVAMVTLASFAAVLLYLVAVAIGIPPENRTGFGCFDGIARSDRNREKILYCHGGRTRAVALRRSGRAETHGKVTLC